MSRPEDIKIKVGILKAAKNNFATGSANTDYVLYKKIFESAAILFAEGLIQINPAGKIVVTPSGENFIQSNDKKKS